MRLIDADKLYPDCLTKEGTLAISQSQIANAPTIPMPDFKEGYKQAIFDGKTNYSRPQGKWIEDDYAGIHCSECDYYPLKDVVIKINADGSSVKRGNWNLTPYCSNCGADMRGGKE